MNKIFTALMALSPLLSHTTSDQGNIHNQDNQNKSVMSCTSGCKISLVESIAAGMMYSHDSKIHQSTASAWLELIASARNSIEIASMYSSIRYGDVQPDDSAKIGENIFQALLKAGRDRGVSIKITQDDSKFIQDRSNDEIKVLVDEAHAQEHSLNLSKISPGLGTMHTKLWVVDRTHFYVGSANLDWRSLTQINELGVVAFNCSCMATDIGKIYDTYWMIGDTGKIPVSWPKSLSTKINADNPMSLSVDGNTYKSFFGSSPLPLLPEGRTNDIDGLLGCIQKAEKFVYISVMDYLPTMMFSPQVKYWPVIENALKTVAIERNIHVRLLVSKWKYSKKEIDYFLKSLEDLTDSYSGVKIEARRFVVPPNEQNKTIPYTRVSHSKYLVTDSAAYIGTSNFAGDYFEYCTGIGMVIEDAGSNDVNSLRAQTEALFLRDWNSPYAFPLNATF